MPVDQKGRPWFERCVLHIGHGKTGTTSIQRTLHRNREALEHAGFHYPNRGPNHRFLVGAFHPNPESFNYFEQQGVSGADVTTRIEQDLAEFDSDAAASRASTMLLSSEHMSFLDPKGVGLLVEFLRERAATITILCYARHPRDMVTSATQEKVKNGAATLEDMRRRPPFYRFSRILPRWVDAAGRDALELRSYLAARQAKGGVIGDYCSVVGLPVQRLEFAEPANTSLTAPAVALADELARLHPRGDPRRVVPRYLRRVRGPVFRLPDDVLSTVDKLSAPDLEYLQAEFDLRLDPPTAR